MAANMNFVRKPQCDFGWDWGPCFAPAGIFGKVELAAYNRAHLTGAARDFAVQWCRPLTSVFGVCLQA